MAEIPVYASLEEKRPFFENEEFFIIERLFKILFQVNFLNFFTTFAKYKYQ